MKYIVFIITLLFCSIPSSAQEHDDEKYKQIKSMETGEWGFAPDWYYYIFHKKYSGAYTKWKWRGFKSGWFVFFDENKSNVKRVLPTREKATATQLLKQKEVEEERKHIEELQKEEIKRAADRNIDLVYSSYKDDFSRLNKTLLDGFTYILRQSKGKLSSNVTTLSRELNIINERISYIHKTGVGYELENAKRETSYIEAKQDLEKLVLRTQRLALYAKFYY